MIIAAKEGKIIIRIDDDEELGLIKDRLTDICKQTVTEDTDFDDPNGEVSPIITSTGSVINAIKAQEDGSYLLVMDENVTGELLQVLIYGMVTSDQAFKVNKKIFELEERAINAERELFIMENAIETIMDPDSDEEAIDYAENLLESSREFLCDLAKKYGVKDQEA